MRIILTTIVFLALSFKCFAGSSSTKLSDQEWVEKAFGVEATLVFQCTLSPESFSIFKLGENEEKAAVVVRKQEYSEEIVLADWEAEGTGACRHGLWSFDYKGKMAIATIGCYGEIIPPENAEGEIWFHYPEEYNRSYFCY